MSTDGTGWLSIGKSRAANLITETHGINFNNEIISS